MILINLLPHREAARKRKREAFFISVGISALLGGLLAGAAFGWYQAQITAQVARNTVLKGEIGKLEGQIKEIGNLQTEIAALKARQQAVENLQSDRNLPVNLMNDLVKNLPDGVFINRMVQKDGSTVEIGGVAQSNERITELLRNIASSTWMVRPELGEIVGAQLALTPRDIRRVANFTMRIGIRKPNDPPKAGSSAPAGPTPPAPALVAASSVAPKR